MWIVQSGCIKKYLEFVLFTRIQLFFSNQYKVATSFDDIIWLVQITSRQTSGKKQGYSESHFLQHFNHVQSTQFSRICYDLRQSSFCKMYSTHFHHTQDAVNKLSPAEKRLISPITMWTYTLTQWDEAKIFTVYFLLLIFAMIWDLSLSGKYHKSFRRDLNGFVLSRTLFFADSLRFPSNPPPICVYEGLGPVQYTLLKEKSILQNGKMKMLFQNTTLANIDFLSESSWRNHFAKIFSFNIEIRLIKMWRLL